MGANIPQFSIGAWNQVLLQDKVWIHPGLWLYRFLEDYKKDKKAEQSTALLKKIVSLGFTEYSHLPGRQEEQVRSLKNTGWSVCRWRQKTLSRLACGLGIPSSTENGLFMDRTWGVPYIAGSSLKGVAKDRAHLDEPEDDIGKKEHQAMLLAVFGSYRRELGSSSNRTQDTIKGRVIFLDGYPAPEDGKILDLDIMNPHYGAYYDQGKEPPADYLNPNPIHFLTVARGVPFTFAVAARGGKVEIEGKIHSFSADSLCRSAYEWTHLALQELGVGSKTRVGYGLFEEPTKAEG